MPFGHEIFILGPGSDALVPGEGGTCCLTLGGWGGLWVQRLAMPTIRSAGCSGMLSSSG